jgi:protein subunit release factor B
MSRSKMFSVTAADCRFQAKRGSGKGGQARNKTSNAIQCFHDPSGAMGECEDTRSQDLNRREAFKRMAATPEFQGWLNVKIAAYRDEVEIAYTDDNGNQVSRKLRGDEV